MITPKEQAANVLKWVAALESGEYKKGELVLYNKIHDTYCCLGVACKILDLRLFYQDGGTMGFSPELAPVIGLHDANGGFKLQTLTNINDIVYSDDTDFTNMVKVIKENASDIFIEPVAKILLQTPGYQ